MKHTLFYQWFSAILLSLLTTSLTAQSTTWTGASNNSWSNAANWNNGLPSITSGSPSAVVFGTNDLNGDTLTLDGTYYLNSLLINAADYAAITKEFAATGTTGSKLVFQALNGVNPTLNLNLFSTTTVTANRNLTISANMELANNLTITRVGGGSTASLRRVAFNGILSGNAALTVDAGSNSSGGMIQFTNHNTFTGDVNIVSGYIAQTFADSLGPFNKTINFGSAGNYTWDLTASSASRDISNQETGVGYNLRFHNQGTAARIILLHTGGIQRQMVMSGNITGGTATTALQIIAQTNQQLIFTGEQMNFTGFARIRYGSEVVVANANSNGVAWENVSRVVWNEMAITSNHESAFLLRGDFTYNGNIDVEQTATTFTDQISLGQINHQGTAYDTNFNGKITVTETDFRNLNLVSESNGSATFNDAISIAAGQGMNINKKINPNTSGGTLNYYETTPTGTIIISETSRVASTATSTDTIGTTDLLSGTLLVDTQHFYSAVNAETGTILGGKGNITGNVYIAANSQLNPGGSNNDLTGALTITGNLDLGGPSTINLDIAAATFNIGSTAPADIPTTYSAQLQTIGNHDHLTVTGAFTILDQNSITINLLNGFLPNYGDVFHLLDFVFLNLPDTAVDYENMWDLPDLSALNPAWEWNFDLVQSHGVIFVVPEPQRALLLLASLACLITRRQRHLR